MDGSVLAIQAGNPFDGWGHTIAGGGDLNADGFPDFAVSAAEYNDWTGRIYIYPGNPVLQVDPLTAGQTNDFQVHHFAGSKNTWLGYSTVGLGATPLPQLNLNLDILSPVAAAGYKATDIQGKATWQLRVPASASGITITMQAVQYGLKTNVVSQTIQKALAQSHTVIRQGDLAYAKQSSSIGKSFFCLEMEY